MLDGAPLGSPLTNAGPTYSMTWNTSGVAAGSHTISAVASDGAGNTASASITVTLIVLNTLLQLNADASEVSATTNGSIVTPAIAPSGFTGTVVVNGSGSVNFTPAVSGDGVFFLNCCANSNNSFYKFTGAPIGNIFNTSQGKISFYLVSSYSFAQRTASASGSRYAFDVHDANLDNHLFYFYTQVSGGHLLFGYRNGGTTPLSYFVPSGTEDTLFGNGVSLKVTLSWAGTTSQLFFNDQLVQSASYTQSTPNWTAASNFDFGAFQFETYGGYNSSDDVIDEFTVSGPAPVG